MPNCRRALAVVVLLQLGCDGDRRTERGAPEAGDDVMLEAAATREALGHMLSLETEPWDWSAGFVRTPTDGAVVPSEAPFTFTWTTDLVHEDRDAANEPALAGVAFLLHFSTPKRKPLARVFTTLNEYTPSDELWTIFIEAGEAISLNVDSADFTANRIVEGGGPFSGLSSTFTIPVR